MTASPAATVRHFATRFVRDETGATAIEYSLMAAMMALACITAFTQLGGAGGGIWGNVANKASTAMK